MMAGQLIGVGVGPGDPELITLKAARFIEQADVISYIANPDGESLARRIAEPLLPGDKNQQELPIVVDMYAGRAFANQSYDEAAVKIREYISQGLTVVYLCEGDPLFFGSFSYLLERLKDSVSCQVVPGITSVNSAASALKVPLTVLAESFAVVSGRHDESTLVDVLKLHDSVVIMKAGKSRQTILSAIEKAGRMPDARYLENISRENEFIEHDLTNLMDDRGPYFSLFVVTKQNRNTRA